MTRGEVKAIVARKEAGAKQGTDDECRIRKFLSYEGGPPRRDGSGTFPATQYLDERDGGPEGKWNHTICEWDDVVFTKLVQRMNEDRVMAGSVTQGYQLRYVSQDWGVMKSEEAVEHLNNIMPTLQDSFKWNLFRATVPLDPRSQ